ncbi:MAG: hypothetical protein ACREMY_09220, partial [bacterium]
MADPRARPARAHVVEQGRPCASASRAGLLEADQSTGTIGSALDRFIGRWPAAAEKRLLESIAACETVDEALC